MFCLGIDAAKDQVLRQACQEVDDIVKAVLNSQTEKS